jgi:hypothetical protein
MFSVDISALPKEVVSYGIDQFGDRMVDEEYVAEAQEQFLANEEYRLDYDADSVVFSGTIVTNVLRGALAEKIQDIEYEVRHGERDDFDMTDVEFMREALQAAFE